MVMGMPWLFDICEPGVGADALREIIGWLRWVDAVFSTYRRDSQISRLNHSELTLAQTHPEVRAVLARCNLLRARTGGYFDAASPYRDGSAPAPGDGGPGSLEPSGLVKGWAIAGAADRLRAAGARNFSVNAGGDVYLSGRPEGGTHWRVGIQHPRSPSEIALTLALCDAGLATSGTHARGEHITDPIAGSTPAGLLSVTVVGPDIATADAYATALFAMGAGQAEGFCARIADYEAILITDDDCVLTTPGVEQLRVC
jgi:thiamine biosynthesis lipoprotein